MLRENINILEPIILITLQKLLGERERERERERTKESEIAYNKQRNTCVSLFRITKRDYFANLGTKLIKDNRQF